MTERALSRRNRYLLYKFWALLGLIRWYSILLMAVALYLAAIYIFRPIGDIKASLMDMELHLTVASILLFMASGFIVNAFYDLEKDLINRPHLTFFERHISKSFSFNCYFLFNALGALLSLMVDPYVLFLNVLFSVVLWLYSHKMRKMKFIGEMGAAFLTVAPFFTLTIYYWDVTWRMVEFIAVIFMFIFAREVVKRVITIKGDIILGDQTLPILIGERYAIRLVVSLAFISIAQVSFFIRVLERIEVLIIFYLMVILLTAFIWLAMWPKNHSAMNRILKLLILMSIASIPFI